MNNDTLIIIYSVSIAILIVFSAFFSSADMAYGSVSLLRIKKYNNSKKNYRSKTTLKLVTKYDFTISVILFLNDLVNVASETLSALLGYLLFSINGLNPTTGSVVGSVITLLIVIIFGEILPKSLTKNISFKCALAYAPIINVCYYAFMPVAYVANAIGKLILLPIHKKKINKPDVTDEELEEMVDVIEKEGVVDKDNADILRGTIDNIIGFVTVKDLIRLKLINKTDVMINEILKQPLRFPRSTEINDILQAFTRSKTHFAIVLDEYGGVEGIVTMEDILEEIVGEIWDEEDDVDEPINQIGKNTYIVDGMMNLTDFFETFNIDPDSIDTDYVTIGGFCIELLDDRFAKINDVIQFKNLMMTVIAVDDNNTIEKLRVHVKNIKK